MQSLADLARILRGLRRRHARRNGGAQLTYREMAAATGWSHGIIGEYMAGRVLPPTDRFDVLIRLLGASPAEQGALATARDRIEEQRRSPSGARSGPEPLLPRQLPMDVYGFTGRAGPLASLDGLLAEAARGAQAPICVVSGAAGIGKTALAVRWAHRVADRFPDGQLYVDLRGYDPEQPVPPGDALAGLLRGLGVDGVGIPNDLAERAALYRSVLADRRILIVLDNARDADQARPLLAGAPACFVVVTSRDDLAGLVAREGARRIDLGVLTAAESHDLLRVVVGTRVDENPSAAEALAEQCARLPLALRLAAELAVARPSLSLSQLLGDLADGRRLDRLDAGGDQHTAVRSVFSWSYRHLTALGARAFGLLGMHPGHVVDAHAAAALTGKSLGQAQALVAELARARLIEPAGPGGHAMHDLLRAYAAERALETIDTGERHAALTRLFDLYLRVAAAATDTLFPHERGRPDLPTPGVDAPQVDTPERATVWLDEQRANIVAVAVYAGRHGWPRHSVDLSRVLWRHFEVGGYYQEALAVHTAAAEAAADDPSGQASVLANLGSIHWWLGNYREALRHVERSLVGCRGIGDPEGEARALARLALVHERLGEYDETLACLHEALTIYRRTGNRHGEGAQLVNLGALHRRLGRYAEAAQRQREAAAVFAEVGDVRLEGYALGNLGLVESLLGCHTEALAHLRRALENCQAAGDRGGEGSALATIGVVLHRLGERREAFDHLRRALAISRETGDRSLEVETLNALGETLRAVGRRDAALVRHRAAFALSERTGDRYEQARALDGIAQASAAAGRLDEARRHWRDALAIYQTLGVPEADQVRTRLSGERGRSRV